jgi:NAD(P)-dependent dehydrogenase (short-subunit alcohol dehydrogenase family)
MLARTFAAETASTKVRVNVLSLGPVATRMLNTAMPGLDPSTVDAPETVAPAVVELCLPSVTETGKLYDFRAGQFLDFKGPG